jgi:hypothetical protein
LLRTALRTDGIVRLSRPRTSIAEVLQRHLTSNFIETQRAGDVDRELATHVLQLLVRAGAEEFLLSRSEYYDFCREYHFMRGGHAIGGPDAAARAKGADGLLTFDPADRTA